MDLGVGGSWAEEAPERAQAPAYEGAGLCDGASDQVLEGAFTDPGTWVRRGAGQVLQQRQKKESI